jgi:hypothetical protein
MNDRFQEKWEPVSVRKRSHEESHARPAQTLEAESEDGGVAGSV